MSALAGLFLPPETRTRKRARALVRPRGQRARDSRIPQPPPPFSRWLRERAAAAWAVGPNCWCGTAATQRPAEGWCPTWAARLDDVWAYDVPRAACASSGAPKRWLKGVREGALAVARTPWSDAAGPRTSHWQSPKTSENDGGWEPKTPILRVHILVMPIRLQKNGEKGGVGHITRLARSESSAGPIGTSCSYKRKGQSGRESRRVCPLLDLTHL